MYSEQIKDHNGNYATYGMARANGVRLHYITAGEEGGRTVVLLHGWPETSHQWRHVLPLLTKAGYRVVAPDYRGAGNSERPREGYDKRTMAVDIHSLLHDHLNITEPKIVIGHDLGGQLAYAYASSYPNDVLWMSCGEAPLPGTNVHEEMKTDQSLFHFLFHNLKDLPEQLTAGRERFYLQHFYDKLGYNPLAVDTEHFATSFAEPGAMRAGFELYRAFEQDSEDNRAALARHGKLTMPVLGLHGQISLFGEVTERMIRELCEDVTVLAVPEAGHWISEENPEGLVDIIIQFDQKDQK